MLREKRGRRRVKTWVLKWLVGISEHVMLLFYEPSKGPSA